MNKIFYKIIDSTILEALRFVDCGFIVNDHLLITSSEQTNGLSSKDGVSWFSPYGNLYFTLIIVSIGLNLLSYPPKTINFPATSVLNFCNDYNKCNYLDYNSTANYLYSLFFDYLQNHNISFDLIRNKWLSDAYKLNDEVKFLNSDSLLEFIGINDDGSMLCKQHNGELIEVFHGEISFI